jgi:hypothetical protein
MKLPTALTRLAPWLALIALACGDDPRYLQPREALEVDPASGSDQPAVAQLILPIRLERADEAEQRADEQAELGAPVPFVKNDDLDVSIEWTVKNLDDVPGTALLGVNGANEWFAFVPELFVPEDDDEVAPPPPLMGGVPALVGAGGLVTGVISEGAAREAAIDLELITRGGAIAGAAVLQVNEDTPALVDTATGATVPASLFAGMIRFDLVFVADRHMVLEYAVRVRDHRDLLADELLAADPAELTAFAPADFVPPPPETP